MSYRHPRQTCPVCHRSVATPGGRFARHDPPDHTSTPGFLISCTGSLRQAPPDGEQPLLFEAGAAGADQLDLFGMAEGGEEAGASAQELGEAAPEGAEAGGEDPARSA
ncbi:hypothetical protein ACFWMQ_28020 [Streptomyces sp. NPDC058372]|uniref:hypothetical protein n=1 Tax=Streptomyces sp. NPDC058372 TaxID=3346464 RepID=UPI00364BA497